MYLCKKPKIEGQKCHLGLPRASSKAHLHIKRQLVSFPNESEVGWLGGCSLAMAMARCRPSRSDCECLNQYSLKKTESL